MPSQPSREPVELTDAQAEAFIRYLTLTPLRKKKLVELLLETKTGRNLLRSWLVVNKLDKRFIEFMRKSK